MALDGNPEADALLAWLKAGYVGGRAYEGVQDEQVLAKDTSNFALPYLVLFMLEPYPSFQDRSIAGEEVQPYVYPFIIESWGKTATIARQTAGGVRGGGLVGLQLSENVSQIRLGGGGSFTLKDAAGKPTRFSRTINGEMLLNLATANPMP